MIEEFNGYNHRIRCGENEFYDMKNLTGDDYPVLSTRKKRGIVKKLEQPQGITCKNGLAYVDNGNLYINNEIVELKDKDNKSVRLSPVGDKQLISMGAYLIILPDKVWFNTKTIEAGYIEQENIIACEGTPVTFATCDLNGDKYNFDEPLQPNYVNCLSSEPNTSELKDGYLWFDTVTGYIKKWAKSTSMWVTISSTYIKMSAPNIGKNIKEGDAVDIEGCMYVPNSEYLHGVASLNGQKEPEEGEGYVNLYVGNKVVNPSTFPSYFEPSPNGHIYCYFIVNSHLYSYNASQYEGNLPCFNRVSFSTVFGDKNNEQLNSLNTNMLVQKADKNYIIVTGIISAVYKQIYGTIKISRTMPIMDYVIENNNRLWGCRYGANKKGEIVNEIYASKQGDFKNWSCYAGISTDSYAVSVGSEGEFTGAISYGNYPLFFKENFIHRVAGSIPSQYQMVTTNCRGVQKGSEKSLVSTDEILFYKSACDVCIYQGSLPSSISAPLGNINYKNAVAGAVGSKYYISMQRCDNLQYEMFVYDLATQLWHKEDNTKALGFATVGTDLYYISDNKIISPTGHGEEEKEFDWYFETGVIGYSYPDNKYLGKMCIRVNMNINAVIKVLIQYNSSGEWENIGYLKGRNIRSYNLPIKPKRCDHFKIKFEGYGDCKIFSISKYLETGSDTYV